MYLVSYSYYWAMTVGERPAGVLCINPWHQSGSSSNSVLFSRHIAGWTMQPPLYSDQMRIQFDLFAVSKFVFLSTKFNTTFFFFHIQYKFCFLSCFVLNSFICPDFLLFLCPAIRTKVVRSLDCVSELGGFLNFIIALWKEAINCVLWTILIRLVVLFYGVSTLFGSFNAELNFKQFSLE